MKIKFYGSAKEVGRSCIAINNKYLLDCGLEINDEIQYPETKEVSHYKAIFLAHGHLDHSGAIPYFNHLGLNCPIFCTKTTKKIAEVLMKDELKIQRLQHEIPTYNKENIWNVLSNVQITEPYMEYFFEDVKYKFLPAGHIPGSCSIFIEIEGKSLLYTSDINTTETQLMPAAEKMPHADIMICESTYGDREHPDRKETEQKFLDNIKETIKNGGSVIIPVFAVGRAQEIMLLLNQLETRVPMYLDGMAEKITELTLSGAGDIKQADVLRKMFKKMKTPDNRIRDQIVKEQSIIVTTSGMMDGGPVIEYLKHMYFEEKNAILITGYQAKNANGRRLLEKKQIMIDDNLVEVKCNVEQFDFSAHAGRKQIIELIRQVNPDVLIINHGEPESCESIASEFKDKEVHIPSIGEEIEIN